MSFSSLLPPPKRSITEKKSPNSSSSLISKNKELVLKALTENDDQNESSSQGSIFDSVVGSKLNFQDFVPIRQRNFNMEIPRPSQRDIEETYKRTKRVFDKILSSTLNPQTSAVKSSEQTNSEAYVMKYDTQVSSGAVKTRTLKIVEKALDPLQPSSIKAKKAVAPPADEVTTPLFHKTDTPDSTKTLSKEERAEWDIPAAISSWKNPQGHTLSIERRLAMDARYSEHNSGPQEISEGFANLANALEVADREARHQMKLKAETKRRLADEEAREKEEKIRLLAQKAREERESERLRFKRRISDRDNSDADKRKFAREARRYELEKDTRQSKMSTADRLRELAYAQGRDISERVILSAAKATNNSEGHYDSRLFSKAANANARSREEQLYDSPLFDQQTRDSTNRANLQQIDSMIREDTTKESHPIQFTEAVMDSSQEGNKEYGLQDK